MSRKSPIDTHHGALTVLKNGMRYAASINAESGRPILKPIDQINIDDVLQFRKIIPIIKAVIMDSRLGDENDNGEVLSVDYCVNDKAYDHIQIRSDYRHMFVILLTDIRHDGDEGKILDMFRRRFKIYDDLE